MTAVLERQQVAFVVVAVADLVALPSQLGSPFPDEERTSAWENTLADSRQALEGEPSQEAES